MIATLIVHNTVVKTMMFKMRSLQCTLMNTIKSVNLGKFETGLDRATERAKGAQGNAFTCEAWKNSLVIHSRHGN